MLVSAGHIESNGRAYEFESSARIFPDDEGTFVGDFFLEGPDGLKAAYESRTTRITVFAGEEHHGELTIDSRHGRVEMIGDAVGGHGTHAVRFDGVLTAQVHQVSGLTDLIDRIVSSDGGSLADPTTEAAVRQVFRFRNNATTGAVKLLQAIHLP
jgi:hypothetical protein